MHSHFPANSGEIAFQNLLLYLSIFLPYFLRICAVVYVVLKYHCHIERRLHLSGSGSKSLIIICYEIIQYLFELVCLSGTQSKSRQRYESLAQKSGIEPRITCLNLSNAVMVSDERVCAVQQLLMGIVNLA